MANEVDISQARQDKVDELNRLDRINKPVLTVEDSLHNCTECSAIISDARRVAVPGVTLCADCKSFEELQDRRNA